MSVNTLSSKSYKNRILFAACLSSSLVPFMGSSLNLALPHIAREFSMSGITQSWIPTVYLLSTAILQVPFGRLADIWGKRNVFITGLCIFAVTTFLCGFASDGASLIVLRTLQGIGSAMTFSTNVAIISSVFPPKERGTAMGINAATVYVSIAAGPSLGGFITQSLGWEFIFFIAASLATLSLVCSLIVMKEAWVESKGEPFDMKGSVIYGFAVMTLIYGLTVLPRITGFMLIALSTLLFVVFVKTESKEKYPVFKIHLFTGNRIFRMSSAAALVNYAATFPIGFLVSLYLQEVKMMDAQSAGLILIVQPVVQSVLSPFAGKLSDRIQPRRIASAGMALIAVVLFLIAWFITPESSTGVLLVMLGLLGVGFAAFSSPNTNAIMGSVERKNYSMASATTGTVRLMGQAFSMGITTMIISIVIGKQAITPEVSDSLMKVIHITFIIFAVICAFGVYASAMAKDKTA
ncbi:MAG: MFS transporter [Tannerella sp.]|jgi:EmrB/QacA subfamily drug resistance transporter|nr:MFS transporter [Tannerella sp.]